MEEQILKDPQIYPSNEIIKKSLTNNFDIYLKFIEKIEVLNLNIEWRYYNDGKVWLGKILNKKKNIGWLSIWNSGFKVSIFFTEKTINDFNNLNINNNIKSLIDKKHIGKLIPLIILVNNENIINDIVTILEYKMRSR